LKYISKQKFFGLCLVLTLLFSLSITYAKSISRDISNSVLRLHILANSNSDADQNLKLAVRDRILKEAGHLFEGANSADDAVSVADKNLNTIIKIAKDEIKRQGFDYPVNAEIGNFAFPTKSYGDITLPSGKYRALRIKIGNAAGENWWCVMYPPLCLTDGILSCTDDTKNHLKSNLSAEEYRLITKEQSGAIPVEIRFKLIEVIQNIF
jgi:stage II sporulation protein R